MNGNQDDTALLNNLEKMVNMLNNTLGTNEKQRILKENFQDMKPMIKRLWHPSNKTNIGEDGLEKFFQSNKFKQLEDKVKSSSVATVAALLAVPISIEELFDDLVEKRITGDRAKEAVGLLVLKYPEHASLIKQIMTKKVRTRMGHSGFSVPFPDLFQPFEVTLAHLYTDSQMAKNLKKYSHVDPPAYISPKVDGVRLLTTVQLQSDKTIKVTTYSRTGKEYTTLDNLKKSILRAVDGLPGLKDGIVFDGELVALDSHGREDFKKTVSEARKKDVHMEHPHYKIFDLLGLSDFLQQTESDILSVRLENLQQLVSDLNDIALEVLEQVPFSQNEFERMKKKALDNGWEGIMVRMNTVWKSGRTNDLLKVKFIQTEEFICDEIECANKPFPNKSGGEEILYALEHAGIMYKGCRVWVGSGFDKEERLTYAKHPELIKGQKISVQFQEEIHDPVKKTWSLRHPVFKGVVGKKRDF